MNENDLMCDVCAGDKSIDCVCGGTNNIYHTVTGMREEYFKLETKYGALLDRLENMAEGWRLTEKYDPVYFPGVREPRLNGNDCFKELNELIKEYRDGP